MSEVDISRVAYDQAQPSLELSKARPNLLRCRPITIDKNHAAPLRGGFDIIKQEIQALRSPKPAMLLEQQLE